MDRPPIVLTPHRLLACCGGLEGPPAEHFAGCGRAVPCSCGSRVGCEAHGHQPREHAVPCQRCRMPTWNHDAICTRCHGGSR